MEEAVQLLQRICNDDSSKLQDSEETRLWQLLRDTTEYDNDILQKLLSISFPNKEQLRIIGLIYLEGWGVLRDFNLARSYFERSKCPRGTAYMGMLERRIGKHEEGVALLKEASDMDDGYALFELGCYNYHNLKDTREAVRCWRASVAQKFPAAFTHLAICYRDGIGDIDKNLQHAIRLFEEGARSGVTFGLTGAAMIYFYEMNNEERAMDLLELAVRLGDMDAHVSLASILAERDEIGRAEVLLRITTKRGMDRGHLNLGRLLEQKRNNIPGAVHHYYAAMDSASAGERVFNLAADNIDRLCQLDPNIVVPWGQWQPKRLIHQRFPARIHHEIRTLLLMVNRGVLGAISKHVVYMICKQITK